MAIYIELIIMLEEKLKQMMRELEKHYLAEADMKEFDHEESKYNIIFIYKFIMFAPPGGGVFLYTISPQKYIF